jgi:phosphoglycolate phosphatase
LSIRGVIFDLDGTVAHTLPDIAAGVNAALASFGLPERPLDEIRMMVGEGLPTLCKRAITDYPEVPLAQMLERAMAEYRIHRTDKTTPFTGVPELLDALRARGIPIAILTNKPHEHTEAVVDAFFGRWPWIAIEGYREESRRKPDPRTALEIVEKMHARPEEVLMVGDSKTDVHTAINAGLVPVGVTWGYRPREELMEAGAKRLIDRPADLLAML